MTHHEARHVRHPHIKVVGVGGAGCNALNRMVREGLQGVDFVAVNSDVRSLELCEVPTKVHIGESPDGLGAGGDPRVGSKAAEESRHAIWHALHGAEMVFITAGMGGGTGTGAAPIVAEIARDLHQLTIAVVTRPFPFEGAQRQQVAEAGIAGLQAKANALIVVPNEHILHLRDGQSAVEDAFKMADSVLHQSIASITEFITAPAKIRVDYASVRSVLEHAGPTWLSVGTGTGEDRAVSAAKNAISNPLLDASLSGAAGALFMVAGGSSLTLHEVSKVGDEVAKALGPQAKVVFGLLVQPEMAQHVRVTLIATGVTAGPRAAGG